MSDALSTAVAGLVIALTALVWAYVNHKTKQSNNDANNKNGG